MTARGYVLLGDVRGSRGIADREGFRKRLVRACSQVNQAHGSELAAPCELLKGIDEVGAVLGTLGSAYDIMSRLLTAIEPAGMRFVLIRGSIDVKADSGEISLMDGPAFHEAARAMTELKRLGLTLWMRAGDELVDVAIEGEVNLLWLLKWMRTERQEEVITAYEETGNQAEAARALGVSQQAVSGVLGRSRYREARKLERALPRHFLEYAKRLEGTGEVGG